MDTNELYKIIDTNASCKKIAKRALLILDLRGEEELIEYLTQRVFANQLTQHALDRVKGLLDATE